MTSQSGGGGGIAGLTGDGFTPPGIVVSGSVTAGDNNAASVPSFHSLYGDTWFGETLGNVVDGDKVVEIHQQVDLPTGSDAQSALTTRRSGSIVHADYQDHHVTFTDVSGSAMDCLRVTKETGIGNALRVSGLASFSAVIGENNKPSILTPASIIGNVTTGTLADLQSVIDQLLTALDAKGSIVKSTT